MVAILYLIRHGEPEGAGEGRYRGWSDVPLSAAGRRQMDRVAGLIAHDAPPAGLRAVYCSDLQRAVVSAGIIGDAVGCAPIRVPGLRERNFGIWEGLQLDEIRERHPAAYEAWGKDPWAFRPVGGEDAPVAAARVLDAFRGILHAHAEDAIAVVAHGGANRIILAHCLGMRLEHIFRIGQEYAAVNIVEFREGTPVVRLVNGGEGRA